MCLDREGFEQTLAGARKALLDARNREGVWEGELSSSALSTATAVFSIHSFLAAASVLAPEQERELIDPATEKTCRRLVRDGLAWLALNQNKDGGWGDTTVSFSNISTTSLCWAALAVDDSGAAAGYSNVRIAAEAWLIKHAGGLDSDHLVPAIIARYGKDKTFSVPILTMCALAGRLGADRVAWKKIPQLPFELAAFPQRGFKWLHLPVVSYALPALIAIGLVRHVRRPTRNPVTLAARTAAKRRTLRLLRRIQPPSGGFLEATPLTSFVLMSLVGANESAHPVARQAVQFLIRSARCDGSWPIDTNLSTWVTTLAINALAINPDFKEYVPEPARKRLAEWLREQQYRQEHPYTLANPGGWAWTPLSGGVPDADDTAGALLAIRNLDVAESRQQSGAAAGVRWLLDLQNHDGGTPTFCRGWGKLPFDQSSADITAHTLRAVSAWKEDLSPELARRWDKAKRRATGYLSRVQQSDGAWTPLWFGNQRTPDDVNPTYGTARVLLAACADSEWGAQWPGKIALAVGWLLATRHADGGWGGGRDTPSSIEETALAVEALALALHHHRKMVERTARPPVQTIEPDRILEAVIGGVNWLVAATDRGAQFPASPIGFYFAKLWYFEALYPLIFSVAALESAQLVLANHRAPL